MSVFTSEDRTILELSMTTEEEFADYKLEAQAHIDAYLDVISDLRMALASEKEAHAKTTSMLVKLGRSHCRLLAQQ